MNCPWNEKLDALHDGELARDSESRRGMESHVAACPECAAELERLRRVGRFLTATPMPAMSSDAFARLRGRLGAERLVLVNGRRTVRLASWLTAAAAAVMLCCGAALYSTQAPQAVARHAVAVNLDVPLTPDLPVVAESDDPLTLAVNRYEARDDGSE